MQYNAAQLIILADKLEKIASRCNCENSKCNHEPGDCKNEAGSKKALYVGAICDHCAKHMPEKYMKKDATKKQEKSQYEGLGSARHEHEEWEKHNPKMRDWSDKDWSRYLGKKEDSNNAKDNKLDPKAKVRNRGTVCVPASQAKDKKDHFPINDIDQARNALSRVHQYSKVPEWYSGSLKGLQSLVSRKVHSKYPSIGKDKKTSAFEYIDDLVLKYGSTFSLQ